MLKFLIILVLIIFAEGCPNCKTPLKLDDIPTAQPIEATTIDSCVDEIVSCQQYLTECNDPDYQNLLYKYCRKTCNLCSQCLDSDSRCPEWASDGFCKNPFYSDQWKECGKSCKLC